VTHQNKRQHLAIDAMGESMKMAVKARLARLKKVKTIEVGPF